jgi:hypothetical protein
MADQTINSTLVPVNVITDFGGWTAISAANDGILAPPKDGRYFLVFQDTAGGAGVTIRHGDGVEGAQGDIAITNMVQNELYFAGPESARVKRVWGSGTPYTAGSDKGKIRISASANVNVACVMMP